MISFIIPALNEESNIQVCIRSIRLAMQTKAHEIIVVDNGSDDRTVSVASAMGARCLSKPNVNVSELRNTGVLHSLGTNLVFIDADVYLSKDWLFEFKNFLRNVFDKRYFITGSRCLLPDSSSSFIEKNWFSNLENSNSSYINSGHLITTKKCFQKIGGFNRKLETAEDYDFCLRASQLKIDILENKKLIAYHTGYPTTIKNFFLRECWHGKNDISSFRNFINSKTALASITNSILVVYFMASAIFKSSYEFLIPLLLIIILTISLSIIKFKFRSLPNTISTAICFEIYLLARSASFFTPNRRPAARSNN
ncbi:glycosyltransferase [Marinobacter koreensis]|uniref:Glycosyltransferase n=1 Tax=Marinobacter koreensis TaxID=335974 RepID=A0ABW0RKB0_9GAMM|nr:glycosyltransferase [Marinobacter koreensis]MCK7548604.1 glycosyltransferase [Marinobacter koreensis]